MHVQHGLTWNDHYYTRCIDKPSGEKHFTGKLEYQLMPFYGRQRNYKHFFKATYSSCKVHGQYHRNMTFYDNQKD